MLLLIALVLVLAAAVVALFDSLAVSMFREGREMKNSIKRMDAANHSRSL